MDQGWHCPAQGMSRGRGVSRPLRRVGIGFGRMDIWHDGLGEFSRQLGLHLAGQANRLREEQGITLSYHLAKRWHGMFGDQVEYLPLHDIQRWVHLQRAPLDVWHTLHQHNRFRPPLNARARLLTVHDLNFLYFKHPSKSAKYLGRTQRLLDRQTAVVAISRYVRDDIQRHLRPAVPVEVVYNGATDLTHAPQERPPGVPAEGFLLHISRMASSKNVRCLLDLAELMPERPLVLAGPRSADSQAMSEAIRSRGLAQVMLLESISEAQKAWLYAHCAGFLFPSLTEGFGLPPLEAMHFGKPVFLSRLTSLPEVGGEVVHYLDSFEASAMREVVVKGLARDADPVRIQALTEQAQGFNWARCAAEYAAIYTRLIHDTQGAR